MDNTKNNHFVPQFYLKNFCNEDAYIFKGDLIKGKIYKTKDLKAECSKKNIYTVKEKITIEQFEFFCKLFNMEYLYDYEFAHILIKYLNDELADLFNVRIKNNKEIEEKFNNEIKSRLNNPDYSRTQENLFTFIYEKGFQNLYEKIIKDEDIGFIEQKNSKETISLYLWVKISAFIYKQIIPKTVNAFSDLNLKEKAREVLEQDYIDFPPNAFYDLLHFMLIQYFRPEKMVTTLKNGFNQVNINNDNLIFLLIHLKSIELSDVLIQENYKIILVRNTTNKDFIISDCPCSNIYTTFVKDRHLNKDELELYLPLSPKLAFVCSNKICYSGLKNPKIVLTKEHDVDKYNEVVLKHTHRFIYGNNKQLIENLIFNNKLEDTKQNEVFV